MFEIECLECNNTLRIGGELVPAEAARAMIERQLEACYVVATAYPPDSTLKYKLCDEVTDIGHDQIQTEAAVAFIELHPSGPFDNISLFIPCSDVCFQPSLWLSSPYTRRSYVARLIAGIVCKR